MFLCSLPRGEDKEIEMKDAARYIEEHHADWGVALFIVPVMVGAWTLTGIVCFVSWMLR
jgi:hypothetical protein